MRAKLWMLFGVVPCGVMLSPMDAMDAPSIVDRAAAIMLPPHESPLTAILAITSPNN